MNSPDKDRVTFETWTFEDTDENAMSDAKAGVEYGEKDARALANETKTSPWRITITVERIPNEETK
jgi:hypothetical protein